ncbi:prion-inhibition and propagation-domain-containing protein [Aspergillus granulosus]|uniref:Prion-inhibition and propagation-domain-containing protein n=1 Tax=Aspergillus granulosus TaxID=176169 RepID=A0ABR4H7Q2_9EURO
MASQPPTNGGSGIAQLWQAAIQDYEKATGKMLQLGQFQDMEGVMAGTESLSKNFAEFRSDQSKVARVRTALKNNLWLIQRIVNTVQTVGNAASAFPPAMPASLIFSAFGQVMQSFSDVSADYDKIMGFFEFTHRFFDRLSIIDQKMPDMPPFQRCVSRVFSSILRICAIAQKYSKERRFKKWFDSLLNGTDGELAGASSELESAINEMSQAVGLASLKTLDVMNDVVQSMSGNIEFLVSNANLIDERTAAIQSNTNTILEQNQELASKQDEMMDMQQEMFEKLAEQSRLLNQAVGFFGSVQIGESFGKSFQTSLLKVDVIKLRLTRWGQSVGLANLADVRSMRETKLAPEDIPKVQDLLTEILDLISDAEKFSHRFKKKNPAALTMDPGKELDEVSASLHQQMNELAKKRQGSSGIDDAQESLAIYQEKDFSRLVEDTSGLVNDLIDLFPAVKEDQRKICEEEVLQMKKIKNGLPLLREVAAGQDDLLSDMVVKTIQSTTTYNNSVVFQGTNSGFQIGNNSGRINNVRFN